MRGRQQWWKWRGRDAAHGHLNGNEPAYTYRNENEAEHGSSGAGLRHPRQLSEASMRFGGGL